MLDSPQNLLPPTFKLEKIVASKKPMSAEWEADLDDWVRNGRHAVVIRLNNDGKTSLVCAHQGGKIGDHVEGRKLICVSNLQGLGKGCQPIIAEP